jgi:hypothetical protein
VRAVVERYDGDGIEDIGGNPRIAVWQLWNEPNHWETWPGTPEEYGRLMEAGYQAAKEADPTAIVATGGLYVFDGQQEDSVGHQDGLRFMDRVFAAYPPAWNAFDAIAIHPFMPDVAPDQPDMLSKVTLWGRLKTTQDWMIERTAQYGGIGRPMWITELGWSTCTFDTALAADWHADLARYQLPTDGGASLALSALCKSETQQATYMVRAHAIAAALGVQHLSYFQLEDKFDGGHSIWSDMSIVRTRLEHYSPKIAYTAYTVMTRHLAQSVFLGLGPLHTYAYDPQEQYNPAAIYHMTFVRSDNVVVDVLWRSSGTQEVELQLYPDRRGILVTRDGVETPFDPTLDTVRFTIGEEPLYLRQELRNPPTATPVPPTVPPVVPTAAPVPPTSTATPEPTATITPTPTIPPTAVPSPTPLPPADDAYEPDDSCVQAQTIASDGSVQRHTLHNTADVDWLQVSVISGTTYLVESQVAPGTPADLSLTLVRDCQGSPVALQAASDTPGPDVRLTYQAPTSGTLRLGVTGATTDTNAISNPASYEISVRALQEEASGGLILVAGTLGANDPLQPHIAHTAAQVYDLFETQGYTTSQIYTLAPDGTLPGVPVDGVATAQAVEEALTTWATRHVSDTLTLYLIDHGDPQRLYLDKAAGEWITATDLDSWLAAFEAARPEASVTVIIESSSAGSFITAAQTAQSLRRPGAQRVVITATGTAQPAYVSDEGALFSDYLLSALRTGSSLYFAFQRAAWAVEMLHPDQTPMLNSDGTTVTTEAHTAREAQQRSLTFTSTLTSTLLAPFIAQVEQPELEDGTATLRARVVAQPGVRIAQVQALIYPPDYAPPQPGDTLAQTGTPLVTIALEPASTRNNTYTARTDAFDAYGSYRVVIVAEDSRGLKALPAAIEVTSETVLFLPLLEGK